MLVRWAVVLKSGCSSAGLRDSWPPSCADLSFSMGACPRSHRGPQDACHLAEGSCPPHSSIYNLIEAATQLLLAPFLRPVPFRGGGGDRSPAVLRVLDPAPSLICSPFCFPELRPPLAVTMEKNVAWTSHTRSVPESAAGARSLNGRHFEYSPRPRQNN